jgi:hypothetical protein
MLEEIGAFILGEKPKKRKRKKGYSTIWLYLLITNLINCRPSCPCVFGELHLNKFGSTHLRLKLPMSRAKIQSYNLSNVG